MFADEFRDAAQEGQMTAASQRQYLDSLATAMEEMTAAIREVARNANDTSTQTRHSSVRPFLSLPTGKRRQCLWQTGQLFPRATRAWNRKIQILRCLSLQIAAGTLQYRVRWFYADGKWHAGRNLSGILSFR